jgi:hypothetical protein
VTLTQLDGEARAQAWQRITPAPATLRQLRAEDRPLCAISRRHGTSGQEQAGLFAALGYRDRVTGDPREGMPPIWRWLPPCVAASNRASFPRGAMLLSITRISQEWGVAKFTAAKALKELRSEGLTRSVQGWGTFVAGPDD